MKQSLLNLTSEEINIIIEVIENVISDLSMEITDTDKKDYRDKLKTKRKVLQKLLIKLKEN